MLGNKNTKKTSVFSGIGIALLLCALMALMPMAGFVDNNASDVEFVDSNTTAEKDFFALPEAVKTDYEYEPSDELIGMRDQTTKTYITEDGKFAQLNHATPVHFIDDSGAWGDIDLNVVATSNGWEVTENSFETHFAPEMAYGVAVQPNQFVDPIITGIAPMIVTLDQTGTAPEPYYVAPSEEGVTVGGNVLRYPVAEGFDLDYTVESTQLKQQLVIRERPVLEPNAAWFGLSETMQIPSGYALYLGDTMLGEEMTQTQESLEIRHMETGEILAEIPVPVVIEEGSEGPYTATFFIQVYGPQVVITTAVEADWLMSDDRVFPLAIDPTIKVYQNAGGYCYRYYRNCYSSSYGYTFKYYGSVRYMPWHRYTFTSSNALPTGATVDSIKQISTYSYKSGSNSATITASVLEDCGTQTMSAYSHAMITRTCSGAMPASKILTGSSYNSANSRGLILSMWNSAAATTHTLGSYSGGKYTNTFCSTATTCASSAAGGYITTAQTNAGTVGIGQRIVAQNNAYIYERTINSGTSNSYLEIVYSGGSDTDAPLSGFIPYTGVTSYIEGARTFFTTLVDMSGIDTTTANAPTLNYALNNGSYTSVSASSIGTCASSSSECQFKATTVSIAAGDYVQYYWQFQDLNTAGGANVGYDPVLTGSQTAPTPYYFAVEDVTDAGDDKKLTVLTTDVHAAAYFSPSANQYFDRQMTHFDGSDEFYFEFDTSSCGTGSSSCFYSSSYYFYSNWVTQHTTTASSGYNGVGGTRSNIDSLHKDDGGYLTISAANGPGMNLIFLYDSGTDSFAMVGVGTSTSINEGLSGGTSADASRSYGYTNAYKITLGSDYGGMFGKFGFGNATGGAGTNANRLCVTSNGFTTFWRSPYSSYNDCSPAYYYAGAYSGVTTYKWSGFALGMGYYGRIASTGDVTYKIGNVAPTPDTFAPEFTHSALADSHSKDRTITASLSDAGDPPSGLNVSTSAGVGPTAYYRVTPDGGTTGSWTAIVMTQESGSTRAQCVSSSCDWSATIEDLERGDSVDYYLKAQDVSTVAVNTETTLTETFSVGDPNKMFIVEWRDMGYSTTDTCTYQAVFYDVTNEIEFKYDDACTNSYDAGTVGFMDQTRTMGQTIRHRTSTQYITGTNPHPANYRISTSATDSGYESFDRGLTGLVNADASDIMGSSSGNPSGYYCSSSYYWNTWANKCADNIAMPEGFNFTYFGTDYNYTDANDRINLGRHGNMHFLSTGSTALVRSMTTWYGNMPQLPSSASSFARAGTIAPYYSYYGTYYCYQNTNVDCGVYYRTMPFEGKGTDVTSDITQDTTWDITDSPIRVNPSGDYLTISADLTIQPGVLIQVAEGKGISFDGTCDQMTLNGNSTDHILFEGADGVDWTGMAFTAACAAGTDDRHVFNYVDFKNTSDAAISAGSRHGSSPSTNSNVGNFTMDHVTFTNVGSAFSHGSGQGTVVSMSNFNIDGASSSCFDFAQDTMATLTEGVMKDCNTLGTPAGGAIVNVAGSTGGSLFLENTTVNNAYVNLIDVDFATVTVSNVTATTTASLATGTAFSSAAGSGSEVVLYNFDADDYASVSIEAMDAISMNMVDFGTATMMITPGGSSSTGNGPSADNAMFDDVTVGNTVMTRVQPGTFDSMTMGTFSMTGNAITSNLVSMENLEASTISVSGCGWNVHMLGVTADALTSNGCSIAANTVTLEDGDFSHSDTVNPMIYARYSGVTIAVTDVTTSGTGLADFAYADTNSDVRLIQVLVDGATSPYAGADGMVTAASSSEIWYGGLASAFTYRNALINNVASVIYKSGHFVSATVVDSSGSEITPAVGSHVTDATGEATVWVITSDQSGNTYDDHNLRAFGAAGQNETLHTDSWYPTDGTYTVGDTIDLLLEPAPVEFDAAGMDCAWIAANTTLATTYNPTLDAYVFDSTPMTLAADLTLDGCNIILLGSVLKVKSTATSSPVLTLSDGGSLKVTVSPDTGQVGAVKAISSTYGLHIDIQDGTLNLDGGTLRDVAQDSTTGAALFVGPGATLIMGNSATVFGASTSYADMATVMVNGGTVNIADSSIINTGQTGTALWVEASGGSIENVIVKNAAVGIQSYNGAPQVDGFIATDNTVGVDVYGGMSLPTVYRSTLLSGENTGWKTYKIDLSTYIGDDYLQVGWNSIYGGGNAHPTYNYATSKYYMITDRYNIELEDDSGNAWNITQSSDTGYYPYGAADPASGTGDTATYATGATGGVPSWSCDYYGYSYGPGYPSSFDGYFYYMHNYWPGGPQSNPGYPGYYYAPDEFGFDWEGIDGVSPTGSYAYYPYHYWGYYYTSYHGGTNGPFTPPEGYGGGYPSTYNVCLDYAASYYMSPGQGARLTMPTVDISATNISKVSLYIDVLHNRADNFQDRLEFVARSSDNAAELGEYVRESGTPLFKDGTITGADNGIQIGGAYAAGVFENIAVTNPVDSGLEITGQAAATIDGLEVDGGTYGVLIGSSASGAVELANLDLDSQTSAGVYYAKDISGDVTGIVTNSAGAAFKYGQNTDNPVTMTGMTIATNAVGIESAGSGEFSLTDMTMSNGKDVVLSGSAMVEFIEGTIDVDSVDVSGSGMFTRMRTLDVTLTADAAAVTDATVTLLDANGGAAGAGLTDANGVANDLTFVTATVDANGKTVPSLAGYKVMTVAEVAYSYTSALNNIADFRYAKVGATLTDAAGNTEAVALTTKIAHRVCWYSSSTAYQTVSPCEGSFSTSGSRDLSDGDGGTVKEYGYYGGMATNLANEVVMVDVPYIYLNGGTDYNLNGTTLLGTGVYDYYGNQRWYSKSPGGTGIYMNDAAIYGVAVDASTNEAYGIQFGDYFYSYSTFVANNSVFSNVATIEIANGYNYNNNYNWEVENLALTNSTITHYKGYTSLNNAIQVTDICMQVSGGDGGIISGNTFNNCGVGIMLERATYYSYHNGVVGADNITISGNTFNDGGEIADVWLYSSGDADNALITGNTFNSGDTSNGAIAAYPGSHDNLVISDNTINTLANGIYLVSAEDFTVSGNTINGAGDAAHAGIDINGGYGEIDNNTLLDADGGIVLDSMTNPPAPTSSLCTIRSYSYSRTATCSVTLAAGKVMAVNVVTDAWGGEVSISIAKPDGTTDSWNNFASRTDYSPLASYSDAGAYVLTLGDSYGDGGTDVFMVEGGAAGGYGGPVIADNSIELSLGRVSPNAAGIVMEDCDGVQINSARNSVILSDAAMVISNCDVVDIGSTLQGDGTSLTNGINADDANGDSLTLSGTTVAGFENGVIKTSGALILLDDASLTGDSYGAYVDDATVTAITANVDGGATGTGLYVIDSDDVWVYPMNASGLVGMYVENSPFRWDGGSVDATTALEVVEAQGSVENMTWIDATNQINAGTNAYVTSIGNTIDASKLIVDPSATIDEANLFSMTSTHLTTAPSKEVSMLIQSTDGTRASYVSTNFQPEVMNIDGSDADWNGGNALNPSGYAMPGVMSGDGTNDMMVTYIEGDDLYIGLTGEDLSTSDLLIYLSVDGAGSSTGYNLGGTHTLPFQANYVLWADSESSFGLLSYGFLGWSPTSLSSAAVEVDFSGNLAEISIPFSRMGGTPDQIDIVAIVQGENSADVSTVHPTQTIDSINTLQSFTEYITVELTHDDLSSGAISDEVLVYRSYKGSNTPSLAKNYDVMIKTEADCAFDWATSLDVSLATNVNLNLDMARACPEIQAALADIVVDEDSGAYTFSLTDLADDVQDVEATLTWASTSGNIVAFDDVLVDWAQTVHSVTITPLDDQFGTMSYEFTVTDSNGLSDTKNISFEVTNVNDAPVICNVVDVDCMPLISQDDIYTNILAEGFGVHSKYLGNVSNASSSYIRDMANEQSPTRQVYDWDASIPADCIAFGVEVNENNTLVITENVNNELGGTCTVTLTLADDAAANSEATPYEVNFSVAPVNDAPVIPTWDRQNGTVMEAANGSIPAAPWQISLMEDDLSTANLTYDLSTVMTDVDHNLSDLTWTVAPTDQCTYTNYFTTTIVVDQLVFTLIPDATTNAKDWEIDYLNDNGIHQIGPSGSEFCKIRLILEDTATAPSYVPNYDTTLMPIAAYQQGQDDIEIGVRVENVREQVGDYYFDSLSGFSFNGVTNIMTGTYVPVTVKVGAGGDEGPFTYDHMLAVTFHSDGHTEDEPTRFYTVPDYGTIVEFDELVYITKDTSNVWVEMDVVTCLNNPCDLTAASSDRFQTDDPASHRANNNGIQGADWSKPGQYGSNATQTSERRPLLEDSNWCNNRMTSLENGSVCNHANQPPSTFEATGQPLPSVVRTIGASSVPSFAPSIVVVSLTGLFVSALAFSSRRADDEEEVAVTMVDDNTAVSPVIATILMVAITVVLSGVIYVWASSLAETDVKGVPRVTFDIEDIDGFDADQGHWRITVQSSETDLATQAVVLRVIYTDGDGNTAIVEANMADTNGVYGFNPDNSDAFITFVDQVNKEGSDSVSTFNTGDTIFVRTHAADGTPLEDVTITLSYAPSVGQGALLRSWSGLSYDLKA